MPLIPAYFNAPINPEEYDQPRYLSLCFSCSFLFSRALAAELRQKVIPWSRTPFNPIQDDPNFDEKTLPVAPPEEEEEEENTGALDRVEPVPEWLEVRSLEKPSCACKCSPSSTAVLRLGFVVCPLSRQ